MTTIMTATVVAVKRKRFVDANGIHYPVQKVCVVAYIQATKRYPVRYILTLSPERGMELTGSGIKKGETLLIEGHVEGVKSGAMDTYVEMNNPRITMVKPRKRKKNLRIVGFTPDKFQTI